jgi:release factor H-coupled RctB family protein
MTIIAQHGPKARVIAGPHTWVEGEAIRQLRMTAELPGMLEAVGMPDIQPGNGSPSGAAFLSQIYVHPTLVGTDIGCGMALLCSDLPIHKVKVDRLAYSLNGIDQPWHGDVSEWLVDRDIAPTMYDASLGTVGRGNHFIELQQLDSILNPTLAADIGLLKDRLHILVHSGSRGLGESILTNIARQYGATPLVATSDIGAAYLAEHDHAVRWAKANRELCAHRVCQALKIEAVPILDICHNGVSSTFHGGCQCWLHRKGAAPSDRGIVVIPGSRGDLSAVVMPKSDLETSLASLAHGAGRKIARHEAKEKLRHLHQRIDIKRNKWGGRVVCGPDQLAWEEAPECYKSLTSVIDDMVDAGLIDVIAYLRPIVTFKTSEGAREKRVSHRRQWQDDRREARQFKQGKRS